VLLTASLLTASLPNDSLRVLWCSLTVSDCGGPAGLFIGLNMELAAKIDDDEPVIWDKSERCFSLREAMTCLPFERDAATPLAVAFDVDAVRALKKTR
jgi:hypothetical protein